MSIPAHQSLERGFSIRGYLLAAALGAIGGGIAVALITKALPRMMSRMMSQAMPEMMSQAMPEMMSQAMPEMAARMRESGCDPAEM